MAIVHSMDEGLTTVVIEVGDSEMAIWVKSPIEDVEKRLAGGGIVGGDSPIGEVFANAMAVRYLQRGRREVNSTASDRAGLPNLPM